MPLYYDLNRAFTTSGTGSTEVTGLWGHTAANQESATIVGLYAASIFGTAGGGQLRMKTNTGTTASGGTGQTPAAKNLRYAVVAQTIWANDGTAITAGATLTTRVTVGFAQTGGMGGYVPITPQDGIQLMPNSVSPVDVEITHRAVTASVTFDGTLEFTEGV